MEGKRLIALKVSVVREYIDLESGNHEHHYTQYTIPTHGHDHTGEVLHDDILAYVAKEEPKWRYRMDSYDRKVRYTLNNKLKYL